MLPADLMKLDGGLVLTSDARSDFKVKWALRFLGGYLREHISSWSRASHIASQRVMCFAKNPIAFRTSNRASRAG